MTVEVSRVESRAARRDFLALPDSIYRGDLRYAPSLTRTVSETLDPRRNPYFAHASLDLLVAREGRRPLARTTVVVDRRQTTPSGALRAFFGFFECAVDDPAVAGALLGEACRVARARGAEVVEGPFNPNPCSDLGLRTNRFDAVPTFFQPYNPPWYPALLEAAGFSVSARMFTARNDRVREWMAVHYGDDRVLRERGDWVVRPLDPRRMAEDLERVRVVMNEAFASNWRYRPVTSEEARWAAKDLRAVSDPSLVQLVERRGEAVAALICVLDVNPVLRILGPRPGPIAFLRALRAKRRIRRVVVHSVGVLPAYRRSRAFALVFGAVCRIASRFDAVETTWMPPGDVAASQAAARLGLERDVEISIYERRLA